jgi:hypothetical protein
MDAVRPSLHLHRSRVVGGSLLAASLARMQQHVFDDGVGALSVLGDIFEIALQQAGQFVDFPRTLPPIATGLSTPFSSSVSSAV